MVAGPVDVAIDRGGFTRRRFLAGVGSIAVAMSLPRLALGQEMTGSYTGANHGLSVAWDEAVWEVLKSSRDSQSDPNDWVMMGPLDIPAGADPASRSVSIFQTDYAQAPVTNVGPQNDAFEQFLEDSKTDEDFTELVNAWNSEEAVGLLMVQRSYDYVPWLYHEYAQVPVPGHWRRTTIAIPAENIEAGYLTTLLNAITLDGGPPFLAISTEDLVAAMTEAAGGSRNTMPSTPSPVAHTVATDG